MNKSNYVLIILVVSFILNLHSLDVDLKSTCWKGLEIGNNFYYIIFTTDSTYIHYSFGVEEKTFGTYKTYNDSILFNRQKGEFDDDFPEGSRHRIGEKTFWMYHINKQLIPKELISKNGLKFDKYDAKYYDWSYKLIADFNYDEMINNDPYFSYIPDLWPSKWEFKSEDNLITITFEYYKSYHFQKNNSLEYDGTIYSTKDTLFFKTPTYYGLGVKPNEIYDGIEFENGVMILKFQDGKLIGVSNETEHIVFEKKS